MNVTIDPAGLRRELGRRGMTAAECAAIAGLSEATVSHAMTGHRVSHVTVRRLARALTVTPTLTGIDSIIPGHLAGAGS
jgi:transcriptional regulator with XRE-family HTH domain